jgi:hypothetical protein
MSALAETKSFESSARFETSLAEILLPGTADVSPPGLSCPSLVNIDLMLPACWPIQDAKNSMSSPKFYSTINYDFRPESYWAPTRSSLEAALRNVKERNRRETIRDYHSRGPLPALSDSLLRDTLEEDTRRRLDLIHPSFMGGEYLPDYRRDEVEIARIELQSTTSDVISIRARPRGRRIEYSVCDEYQVEYRLPQKTSRQPFSLRELICFLDSVEHPEADPEWKRFGFVLSFNQTSLDCGADLETLEDFTSVESDFYPELGQHFARVIDEWYQARIAELAVEG